MSEDRELREALEKAQAELKRARAELEQKQSDASKLQHAQQELEATRTRLLETQQHARALEEELQKLGGLDPGPPLAPTGRVERKPVPPEDPRDLPAPPSRFGTAVMVLLFVGCLVAYAASGSALPSLIIGLVLIVLLFAAGRR